MLAVAWPASWLQAGLIGEYSFFPIWLGYILTVDALVLRRKGTSLLTRNKRAFLGMFLASVPLWWVFEGINHFTQNWNYTGGEDYSTLRYVLVASWHFSTVIPAVFETAELMGSFSFFRRFRNGPALPVSPFLLAASMAVAVMSLVALPFWPREVFAATWLCLFFLLDPINYITGRPSIVGQVRRGDWSLVFALCAGALICGWFWEMWNYWALPKWHYSIPFADYARIFEMPLLGYGGYLPFGLEIYAVYHFLWGIAARVPRVPFHLGIRQTVKLRPEIAEAGAGD